MSISTDKPAKHICTFIILLLYLLSTPAFFMIELARGRRSSRARNTLVKLEEISSGNFSVHVNKEQLTEENFTFVGADPCLGQTEAS